MSRSRLLLVLLWVLTWVGLVGLVFLFFMGITAGCLLLAGQELVLGRVLTTAGWPTWTMLVFWVAYTLGWRNQGRRR